MGFLKKYYEVVSKKCGCYQSRFILAASFLIGLIYSFPSLAAEDELKSITPSLVATFGPGSTLVHILYLVEIIGAVWAWFVSKHPKSFLGIVIVAMFITWALPHWAFPT